MSFFEIFGSAEHTSLNEHGTVQDRRNRQPFGRDGVTAVVTEVAVEKVGTGMSCTGCEVCLPCWQSGDEEEKESL